MADAHNICHTNPIMTPAINLAKKLKINFKIHNYQHDEGSHSYGLEAAEKLDVVAAKIFKTLVIQLDKNTLAVAIIPVNTQLNMKLLAKSLHAKKATMANTNDVLRSTGYILGGVSPLAQKKTLPTIIDSSVELLETVYVSAGRRGLEIELSPNDLKKLCNAKYAIITT